MSTSNFKIVLIQSSPDLGDVEICSLDDPAIALSVLTTCIERAEELMGELESRGIEPDVSYLRIFRFWKQIQAKLQRTIEKATT